ncbi:MAG: hypothetical protein ACHQAY_16115, partial [Hyphomicrobiales bacterium]
MTALPAPDTVALRPADVVMRLDRLGSAHQTRLSFLRALLRRMQAEHWRVSRERMDVDARGVGTAIYAVDVGARLYSLVAFGHELAPAKRTDRVIAEEWDATFVLYDGLPDAAAISRLSENVPLQEAGRYLASELVLARANRSVRLFDQVAAALAEGRQPDPASVEATGYLMRTTAVYGNGKFGIADRDLIKDRPETLGPFRAEMLTVYLIRMFTVDLVEHLAGLRGGASATTLEPALRRRFGIGNATGLGMAPFLVKHPALLDRWIAARETALARVRAVGRADTASIASFRAALRNSHRLVAAWTTEDRQQASRISRLRDDLQRLERYATDGVFAMPRPWDALYRFAEADLSLEGQEYAVTLLIEPHGDLVDDLAETMAVDETASFRIDGTMRCGDLERLIARHCDWALALDFSGREALARFWYVSEEKLEPRLGERFDEPGMEREQPLAVARDIVALTAALDAENQDLPVAAFLLAHPEHRHTVRRIQIAARHPYSEIRDNLVGAQLRPIDILRCKLAFFGATRFDPRSDKWLRITLFQGAPFPDELEAGNWDRWAYGE